MNSLNIPLSPSNHPSRRLARNVGYFLLLFIISWLLVRVFFTPDTTTWLRPVSTAYSIHLPILPSSIEQITKNIGEIPLFPGGVWSIDRLLLWCKRSCSLHFDENGSIHALSVDRELPRETQQQLVATGLYVTSLDDKTLVSSTGLDLSQEKQRTSFSWRLLLPWNDAVLLEHSQKKRLSLRVSESGITLVGDSGIREPHQSSLPQNFSTLAQLEYAADNLPPVIGDLVLPLDLDVFLNKLENQYVSLVLGQESGNIAFSIQTPVVLDQAQAAALSRELIKPYSLSTLEWTMEDGTTTDEIVFNDDGISVDSFPSEYGFYMEVLKENELLLRLVQTQESLTIANRVLSLETPENTISSCIRSSRSFIRPDDLIKLLQSDQSPSSSNVLPFIMMFDEIAFSSSKTTLCW